MIFCVEDDAGIRDLMIYALRSAGMQAEGFEDGARLTEALSERRPELIILDIMLPGEDGISILKRLKSRSATSSIPVIMATAKGTEYDKVIGLDLGADDYLAKPFGMMEMVSRVKAVLRRCYPDSEKRILRNGELSMNLGEHTVTELKNSASEGYKIADPVKITLVANETLTVKIHNDKTKVDVPKTGDDADLMLWISLFGLAAAGVGCTAFFYLKKRRTGKHIAVKK